MNSYIPPFDNIKIADDIMIEMCSKKSIDEITDVYIAPIKFSIENLKKSLSLKNDNYGQIDLESCKIVLSSELDSSYKKLILLHEILHGINRMCGIDTIIDDEKEESLTTIQASALLRFIQDNPELIEILMEK